VSMNDPSVLDVMVLVILMRRASKVSVTRAPDAAGKIEPETITVTTI